MKTHLLFGLSLVFLIGCGNINGDRLKDAEKKTLLLREEALAKGEIPRTINPDGTTYWIDGTRFDWTEGFFPGTCWYFYEHTKDQLWREAAEKLQAVYKHHTSKGNHDLGFVFNCSYGNGYRITGDITFLNVMINAGNTLIGRFNPIVGAIKSWDTDHGWQATRDWQFPVIIDNMMNLELLFELSLLTGDEKYAQVATKHANTTMKNHFRPDNSSYHVVDYDTITGDVRHKHTAQGYSHESSWARGQAWSLYGFVTCYRYTKDTTFLEMACRIADYIMTYPGMPEDNIPYWDYNAPDIPNAPRDVSAASITASALYELDNYVPDRYLNYADALLNTLASDKYSAKSGTNNNFILKHSVGSIPHNNEIDVPLNYADYYYVEALIRQAGKLK